MNVDTDVIDGDKILVAPLNWGLGHATRCIPIIDALLARGSQVILASDGDSLSLLQKHYPFLESFCLPSYDINYKYKSIVANIILQSPKFVRAVWKERHAINKIVKEHSIDAILSDNRYGCRSDACPSYFMTHQLRLLHSVRFIEEIGSWFNRKLVSPFDKVLVPDYEAYPGLSGRMGHDNRWKELHYLGPLTRFTFDHNEVEDIDLLMILSGPEPQRSIWENSLLDKYGNEKELKWVMVRGKPCEISGQDDRIISFVDAVSLQSLISRSKHIITRSGYSTIMDLKGLDKEITYVPTPGQTEQEYLARLHQS